MALGTTPAPRPLLRLQPQGHPSPPAAWPATGLLGSSTCAPPSGCGGRQARLAPAFSMPGLSLPCPLSRHILAAAPPDESCAAPWLCLALGSVGQSPRSHGGGPRVHSALLCRDHPLAKALTETGRKQAGTACSSGIPHPAWLGRGEGAAGSLEVRPRPCTSPATAGSRWAPRPPDSSLPRRGPQGSSEQCPGARGQSGGPGAALSSAQGSGGRATMGETPEPARPASSAPGPGSAAVLGKTRPRPLPPTAVTRGALVPLPLPVRLASPSPEARTPPFPTAGSASEPSTAPRDASDGARRAHSRRTVPGAARPVAFARPPAALLAAPPCSLFARLPLPTPARGTGRSALACRAPAPGTARAQARGASRGL